MPQKKIKINLHCPWFWDGCGIIEEKVGVGGGPWCCIVCGGTCCNGGGICGPTPDTPGVDIPIPIWGWGWLPPPSTSMLRERYSSFTMAPDEEAPPDGCKLRLERSERGINDIIRQYRCAYNMRSYRFRVKLPFHSDKDLHKLNHTWGQKQTDKIWHVSVHFYASLATSISSHIWHVGSLSFQQPTGVDVEFTWYKN